MCPINIFKVNKVPGTNMIILTFDSPTIQENICIENERLQVREYRPRPMQCYNCFKYGHPLRYCKNAKVCINCGSLEHGQCDKEIKCANCSENHKANNKNCLEYKREEGALLKANAEHLSVGYARKLLNRQMNYAQATNIPQNTVNKLNPTTNVPQNA